MVGGTGQKLTEATVIVAGAASLAATLMSIVYVFFSRILISRYRNIAIPRCVCMTAC